MSTVTTVPSVVEPEADRWFVLPADKSGFWLRQNDGTYVRSESGTAFPMLTPDDILGQMQLADQLGAGRWNPRLAVWARDGIFPRQDEGG